MRTQVGIAGAGPISMLHRFEEASEFDNRRQLAELDLVASSIPAATMLARNYVGLPLG